MRDLAANDWQNDTHACLNTCGLVMSASVTVAEFIVQSAPYIQKVKEMMKLNARLVAEGKPRTRPASLRASSFRLARLSNGKATASV